MCVVKHEVGGVKTVVRGPALEVRVESGLLALELDQDAASKEREEVNRVDKTKKWESTLKVRVDLILASYTSTACWLRCWTTRH